MLPCCGNSQTLGTLCFHLTNNYPLRFSNKIKDTHKDVTIANGRNINAKEKKRESDKWVKKHNLTAC